MPKVSSITRVLEIIEAVSYASKPLSPLELSQELDIPKPTIHRLIQNLVDDGFLTVDIGGGIVPGKRVRNLSVELWQQRLLFIGAWYPLARFSRRRRLGLALRPPEREARGARGVL